MLSIKNNDKYYLVFKYFWIIALLPKSIQLVAFTIITLFLLRGRWNISKDKFLVFQAITIVLNLLAIIVSLIRFEHETSRVFAAFNTVAITIIAVLLYSVYSRVELDFRRIGRYCTINSAVLLLWWIIYMFFPNKDAFHIGGYFISAVDYFEGFSTRFVGMFSYANLVPFFVLISLPFILLTIKKKNKIMILLVFCIEFAFVYYANSRTGQALVLLVFALYIYNCMLTRLKYSNRKIFSMLFLLVTIALCAICFSMISDTLNDIWLRRTASNSMRMAIYTESLKKMWENSPLFGMGIKDLFGGSIYSYGSHSSFIGYFYKAGIIGGVTYILSFGLKLFELIKWKKNGIYEYTYLACFCGILLWMLLEDVDGANWSVCMFYVFIGIMTNTDRKGKRIGSVKSE